MAIRLGEAYHPAMTSPHRAARRPTLPAIAVPVLMLTGLAGCDQATMSINGHTGVALDRLALTGQTAHEIAVLGPDTVNVVRGPVLAIHAEGDPQAVKALRFVLADGQLGIGRQPALAIGTGTATVTVTTPMVDQLSMAGSGTLSSDRLAGASAGATVAGSGRIVVAGIDTPKLNIEVMGSGSLTGAGHAAHLDLSLAGSGDADLGRMTADDAAIDLAGSGSGALISNGRITGSVAGSGKFVVHGKAHCDVDVAGSGGVSCKP